jgi:hypothetical protein
MTKAYNVTEEQMAEFFAKGKTITKLRTATVIKPADRRFRKWNGYSRDAARIARLNMLAN